MTRVCAKFTELCFAVFAIFVQKTEGYIRQIYFNMNAKFVINAVVWRSASDHDAFFARKSACA
jgi:hypothetical protein